MRRAAVGALRAGLLACLLGGPAAATAVEAGSATVLLIGDSTLAPETGYGDALCQRFAARVSCLNLARGGRSTLSYRAEGLWDAVLQRLRDAAPGQASFVLIQFGHNDQPGKPGRSTDLASEYPRNLERFVAEVRHLGGLPVLMTPLTRRSFRDGQLNNDLRPWAEAMLRVAAAQQVPVADINAASAARVQAMGPAQADRLATAPPPAPGEPTADQARAAASAAGQPYRGFDHTHLGEHGARVFAQLVEQELVRVLPAMAPLFRPAP